MTPAELRELRKATGLTQAQAAALLRYSTGHYQSMEVGRYRIHARAADSIRVTLAKEAK